MSTDRSRWDNVADLKAGRLQRKSRGLLSALANRGLSAHATIRGPGEVNLTIRGDYDQLTALINRWTEATVHRPVLTPPEVLEP